VDGDLSSKIIACIDYIEKVTGGFPQWSTKKTIKG
jgi:hypothetical protein